MTESLNTAQALLSAKNFNGARRVANEFLEKAPDDIDGWILRIRIELEAENYKEALRICRDVLRKHPENFVLRDMEFNALAFMRRKREARRVFEKFKIDFPQHDDNIAEMQNCLDALHGKIGKLYAYMEQVDCDDDDPSEKRQNVLFYSKTYDYFRAQHYLTEVYPCFPDDLELNKALAQNSLQLGKLALSRKYARIALRLSPSDRHMRVLIFTSYLLFLPEFYIYNKFFLIFQLIYCHFGLLISIFAAFLLYGTVIDLALLFERVASIMVDRKINIGEELYLVYLFIFLLVQYPHYWKFFYERKSEVNLRKY